METKTRNRKTREQEDDGIVESGKIPPQNVEAERAVLGGMLLEPDSYYEISSLLKPESFYVPAHKLIFEAARLLDAASKPIDIITINEQLRQMGKIEEAGGVAYINELSNCVVSAANISRYAEIVEKKYLARELIRVTSDIQKIAFDEQYEVEDLIQTVEGRIFSLTQENVKRDIVPLSDVISEALQRIQKAGTQIDGFTGVPSGFKELDKIINGWQPATLNIIAARPAMGKTAFVLSMAKNMAVEYDKTVAFFSLEMSSIELVTRLIVNVSEIEGEKIKRGQLYDYEWEQLDARASVLKKSKIFLDDSAGLSVYELCSKARKLYREHQIDCIIIDYLQLMNASGMNFGNREQEVSMISRSLKALAKELNIPVIALSQLNRGVEGRSGNDKRPQLSDLRESGAIEQDADVVVLLHRPEYYGIKQDPEDGHSLEGIAEVIIAKHRSGSVGNIQLAFKNKLIKFDNLDSGKMFPDASDEYRELGSKINNGSYFSKQGKDMTNGNRHNNNPAGTIKEDNENPF